MSLEAGIGHLWWIKGPGCSVVHTLETPHRTKAHCLLTFHFNCPKLHLKTYSPVGQPENIQRYFEDQLVLKRNLLAQGWGLSAGLMQKRGAHCLLVSAIPPCPTFPKKR